MNDLSVRRSKKRKLKEVTISERRSIVHDHMVSCLSQKDTGIKYNVSAAMVCRLTRQVKKKPDIFVDLEDKQQK